MPFSLSLPIKNKQNLHVLKSRRQYNLFLENYPAFKGLRKRDKIALWYIIAVKVVRMCKTKCILHDFFLRFKYITNSSKKLSNISIMLNMNVNQASDEQANSSLRGYVSFCLHPFCLLQSNFGSSSTDDSRTHNDSSLTRNHAGVHGSYL